MMWQITNTNKVTIKSSLIWSFLSFFAFPSRELYFHQNNGGETYMMACGSVFLKSETLQGNKSSDTSEDQVYLRTSVLCCWFIHVRTHCAWPNQPDWHPEAQHCLRLSGGGFFSGGFLPYKCTTGRLKQLTLRLAIITFQNSVMLVKKDPLHFTLGFGPVRCFPVTGHNSWSSLIPLWDFVSTHHPGARRPNVPSAS